MKKPRTVRNFWFAARVDSNNGPKNISFGPGTAADDGFTLYIYMRQKNDVIVPVKIDGYSKDGQHLTLRVQLGLDTHILETER
jgi:hypothetical protein